MSTDSAVDGPARRLRGRSGSVLGAATLLLAGVVSVALAASTDFVEPASSPEPVGPGPVGTVAADLDGDGDRDVATANISGGNVTVLRNNGGAAFVEFASSPEDAGSFPTGLTAGDLDGDSDQDLVVVDQIDDNVTILRNNGAGNFSQPASSPEPAGDIADAVVAADLDGDGDRDLAVTDLLTADNVTILRNNGSGSFAELATSPEDAGNEPVALAAADLDGDGDNDLAVANQQGGNVTILRNNGSANFAEPATSPEFAGSFPQSIVAARLNGDASVDLAVANQGSDNVTVMRNAGAANFVEVAASPEPVGDRPLALIAANFDGDLDQDLATADTDDDRVTILRNNGSAAFAEPATSQETVGDGPRSLASGDLDGDADPDLAVGNQNSSNVTILRNR